MKRFGILLMMLAIGCLLATGCSKKVKPIDNEALEEEFKHAPAWVLNGHAEGDISAVGSAVIGKSGIQFAKNEALAHGRNELARQTSIKVKALVNNFVEQTGLGDEQLVDRFSKQMTKQITNVTLSGSRQKDMWISPSKELYVLMVMDPATVKESVKRQLTSSYKNDAARWQEFKAKNGEAELEREIEKTFGK
ncbi:MAG: hypothetical protein GY697_09595 [Desulfobacterales bacterium]|nr:hypothetical protein [Desulfobacterales bacterium]